MLLSVDNLKKYFPVSAGLLGKTKGFIRAVDDVSFSIQHGETLGLVGESGCGKTTLGKVVAGLEYPTKGRVVLDGTDIFKESGKKERMSRTKKVQIIFQDPYSSLNPRQTVGKIIGEGLEIHRVGNNRKRKEKVLSIMERVGLRPEHYDRYPHEFSGGQRQRIGIARALTLNPELIVCDEPLSSLDVSIQAQVINLLMEIQEQYDLAYLFISHDLNVVKYVSDRLAVMYLGKFVEYGKGEDIYQVPLHPYTKALLSSVPKMEPVRLDKRAVLKGDVPDPASSPEGCHFHPRCHQVMNICKKQAPQFFRYKDDRYVRCWLYDKS